jgi:ZIP family zinc transporter
MSKPKKQKIDHTNQNRWVDVIGGLALLVMIIVATIWMGDSISSGTVTVWHVFVAASITALATGLGALPFLFIDEIDYHWLGLGNAIAAGLMLGASIGLISEGVTLQNADQKILRVIIGILIGVGLIYMARRLLENRDEEFAIGQVHGANAVQMLMIVGVMTAHSFAEGIGIGVAYGDGQALGAFISTAIAIHNIPEGLAISLILIPRGTSVFHSSLWSIFSSLPQPLMAVPAFLFVLFFRPLLPIGLGLAAGAMLWMVFSELMPEAREELPAKVAYPIMGVAVLGMLGFQFLIE